jgi:hypothetical protein
MAIGIQHVQATQLLELPPSGTRGVSALRNKNWQNSNFKCGTCSGGRSIFMLKKAPMLYDITRQHRGGYMKKSESGKNGPKKNSDRL